MITLHGTYLPTGPDGLFFLWALESGDLPERVRALSPHPLAVETDELWPVLQGLPYLHSLTCPIFTPGPRGFVPLKVTGVALSVGEAVQWLLDLDAAFERCGRPGLRPGRSLKAWSAASKLLLEFLGRGRCLPQLRSDAGVLTAAWGLALPEPEDQARLARLERALPDICRAVVPPGRKHRSYPPPAAADLVLGFIQSGARELAAAFLQSDEQLFDLEKLPYRVPGAASYWVRGLIGLGPADLPSGLPDAPGLHRALDEWAAPASAVRGHGALRTGLRLNLPDDSAEGDWEVELILLTPDDPPATIPARYAWEAMGGELAIGGGRYVQAEQRVLSDLPDMARLWPPLDPLRLTTRPDRLTLDESDVLDLLKEGAALLQEAGFPVLLPEALVRPTALRASLTLRPAGDSRFGLHQLVKVDWKLALGDQPLTYEELQEMARQKADLVRHRGRWIAVDQKALSAALRHLEPDREEIALSEALQLASSSEVDEFQAEGWVADLLERLREPAKIEPVPVPAGFKGELRPYQERGLAWLAFLRQYGIGACLADDMGLGKTIQLIALLLHERETGLTTKPTLLVCPVSLVGNWRRELSRFAPLLKVMIHHGQRRSGGEAFAVRAAAADVVITTYSLLSRDEETLTGVSWAGVVADEAQNVKNPLTRASQVLRRIPSDYRIALTGTPVENHLGDLWSLFAFLNPGLLGGQEEFRRRYGLPIERYRDEEAAARLRRTIAPFVLRRLKTDPTIIDDLPEKAENAVYTNLTPEQAALYEAVVQETLEAAAANEGIRRHGAVLAGLTRLKQICNHPAALAGQDGPLDGRSGKLERLTEMLEEVLESGDRALIFTQFARFGSRLRRYLSQRLGCEVFFMDGSVPREERERLIQRFQNGEAPLFVLSLKAGGVGLNLTAANHVFHFDRWWNPAVEEQATDRAFRIGQTRRVLVHKLITAGTLEERIDQLLAEKRALSAEVIGSGEAWLSSLSTEELRSLIALEKEVD